jgi:hypothetical protein
MNDELDGSGHGLTRVLSWHLRRGTEEKSENSVRIDGVPAEIRTERLPRAASWKNAYLESMYICITVSNATYILVSLPHFVAVLGQHQVDINCAKTVSLYVVFCCV